MATDDPLPAGLPVALQNQRRRHDILPASLPPRGLNRAQAAAYIGVSVGHLDKLVRDGLMPEPKALGSRVVWDRVELDQAFDTLGDPVEYNPWHDD